MLLLDGHEAGELGQQMVSDAEPDDVLLHGRVDFPHLQALHVLQHQVADLGARPLRGEDAVGGIVLGQGHGQIALEIAGGVAALELDHAGAGLGVAAFDHQRFDGEEVLDGLREHLLDRQIPEVQGNVGEHRGIDPFKKLVGGF